MALFRIHTVRWRVRLETELVCVHPQDAVFAVLATTNKPGGSGKTVQVLTEFDAASPTPRLLHKEPAGTMIAAAYVLHAGGAKLCVLDKDLAFSALRTADDAEAEKAETTDNVSLPPYTISVHCRAAVISMCVCVWSQHRPSLISVQSPYVAFRFKWGEDY